MIFDMTFSKTFGEAKASTTTLSNTFVGARILATVNAFKFVPFTRSLTPWLCYSWVGSGGGVIQRQRRQLPLDRYRW